MESIKELRVICQTTAKKDVSNYYMRYVSRFFSIYISRILLPLPVHADQVSLAMIVVGVGSTFIFLSPDRGLFLWGALGLQLWYVLDCADGEVARYRFYQRAKEVVVDKTRLSMTGSYWDYLNHYIVHGLSLFLISYGAFRINGDSKWLLVGFTASFFQMLLLAVHDSKSRAFVGKIHKEASGQTVACAKQRSAGTTQASPKRHSPFKWVFMGMHYSCTFPTVMNVITLTAISNLMVRTGGTDLRLGLILYYAVASGIVFICIAARNLSNKRIDRDFEEQFEFRSAKEFLV